MRKETDDESADPDGENHFVIAPRPGGYMAHAEAAYDSIYGRIESGWEKKGPYGLHGNRSGQLHGNCAAAGRQRTDPGTRNRNLHCMLKRVKRGTAFFVSAVLSVLRRLRPNLLQDAENSICMWMLPPLLPEHAFLLRNAPRTAGKGKSAYPARFFSYRFFPPRVIIHGNRK